MGPQPFSGRRELTRIRSGYFRNWLVATVATKKTADSRSHHSAVMPWVPISVGAIIPETRPRMPQMPPKILSIQASSLIYLASPPVLLFLS